MFILFWVLVFHNIMEEEFGIVLFAVGYHLYILKWLGDHAWPKSYDQITTCTTVH